MNICQISNILECLRSTSTSYSAFRLDRLHLEYILSSVSLESTDGSDMSYLLLEMATIYIRNVESDSEDIYMIITDMIY